MRHRTLHTHYKPNDASNFLVNTFFASQRQQYLQHPGYQTGNNCKQLHFLTFYSFPCGSHGHVAIACGSSTSNLLPSLVPTSTQMSFCVSISITFLPMRPDQAAAPSQNSQSASPRGQAVPGNNSPQPHRQRHSGTRSLQDKSCAGPKRGDETASAHTVHLGCRLASMRMQEASAGQGAATVLVAGPGTESVGRPAQTRRRGGVMTSMAQKSPNDPGGIDMNHGSRILAGPTGPASSRQVDHNAKSSF